MPRVTKDGDTKHLPYTPKGLAQAKAAEKGGATVAYGPTMRAARAFAGMPAKPAKPAKGKPAKKRP